jgi:NAD+ synthase
MSLRIRQDPFSLKEPEETVGRIQRFLRDYLERTGASVFVLGMSGGLDSSVVGALCAKAVGGRRVLGVYMPEKEMRSEAGLKDANIVARKFHIKFETVDITTLVTAALSTLPRLSGACNLIAYGNVKARLRAMVLYYIANRENGLVVGTGDKSEMMLGYFTKYGDGACDLLPLADLYKTTVRELARHLGLPDRIYSKPASPELWPGQTAKAELGLEYDQLDAILWGLERWMGSADIAVDTGLPVRTIEEVRSRWTGSEHKRRPPLALKSGYRTVGSDMRLPL